MTRPDPAGASATDPDPAGASATGHDPPGPAPVVLFCRPVLLRLWCTVAVVVIIAAFSTTAAILRSSSDGVVFFLGDQIAVAGVGLAVAGLAWLPTRPRLRADRDGVEVRGILGSYKRVPWTVIQSVEFRPKWRWARLILPADESISLYAVQRTDGDRAVAAMRTLRGLHAAAHDQHPDVYDQHPDVRDKHPGVQDHRPSSASPGP